MKKYISVIFTFLLIICLCACAKEAKTIGVFEDASIILNEYDKITDEEWQKILELVEAEFETWPGFVMHYIEDVSVGNDTSYAELLTDDVEFDMGVTLKSSFTTGEKAWSGFDKNITYENFYWYLARTNEGQWQLITYGVE